MTKKLARGTLALLLLFVVPLTSLASVDGAKGRAEQILNALLERGWTVNETYDSGLLAPRGVALIKVNLIAGRHYKIVAGGCENAYNVGIALYDENEHLIDRDTTGNGPIAVVDVTPKWTGLFYVGVKMINCSSHGAHYVVQYAWEE